MSLQLRLEELPLLQSCCRSAVSLIHLLVERRICLPGQVIAEEDQRMAAKAMYMVHHGRCTARIQGERVFELGPGEAFGCAVALGAVPVHWASLVCEDVSLLVVITAEAIQEVLSKYPKERGVFTTVAAEEVQTAESWQ